MRTEIFQVNICETVKCVAGFFSSSFLLVVFALLSLGMSCLFLPAGDIKQEAGGYREGPPYQRRGSLQLWQFLVALLDNPTNSHFIAWTGRGMEFKLIEPEEVKPSRFSTGSGESPTVSGAADSQVASPLPCEAPSCQWYSLDPAASQGF